MRYVFIKMNDFSRCTIYEVGGAQCGFEISGGNFWCFEIHFEENEKFYFKGLFVDMWFEAVDWTGAYNYVYRLLSILRFIYGITN